MNKKILFGFIQNFIQNSSPAECSSETQRHIFHITVHYTASKILPQHDTNPLYSTRCNAPDSAFPPPPSSTSLPPYLIACPPPRPNSTAMSTRCQNPSTAPAPRAVSTTLALITLSLTLTLAALPAHSLHTHTRNFHSQTLAPCPNQPASPPLSLADFLAARPHLAHFPNFRRPEHAITFFYRVCPDNSLLSATFATVLIPDLLRPPTERHPLLASSASTSARFFLNGRTVDPRPAMSVRHCGAFTTVLVGGVIHAVHVNSLSAQNAQGYFIATRTGLHDVFVDTRALSYTCVSSTPASCDPPADALRVPPGLPARPPPPPHLHRSVLLPARPARARARCRRVTPGCASPDARRVLRVTLVADPFYCANVTLTGGRLKRGGGARVFAHMVATFEKVADVFFSQTCILLQPVNFAAYCNPKSSVFTPQFYGAQLRSNFAAWWKNKLDSSSHAKILLTGSGLLQAASAGSAVRATLCQPENSFAWAIGCNALVVAHELGHIVGAFHDQADRTNLMYDVTTKDTEPRFSANSLAHIFEQVDCQSTKCMPLLTPPPSPAPVSCSQTTSSASQFACAYNSHTGGISTPAGKVSIVAGQAYGGYVVQGLTKDSSISKRRLAFMAAVITPASGGAGGEAGGSREVFKTFGSQGYITGKLFVSSKDIVISPVYSACCGATLYAHLKVGLYSTVTNNGVVDRKLFNASATFPLSVACTNPCAKDPAGTSVAAAPGVTKCPACIPSSYTPMDTT